MAFNKDAWILDAIARGYIRPQRNGTVLRCDRTDTRGNLLAETFSKVVTRIHKKTGRVYWNMTWRGITKSVLLNRVIALAFLPNPLNLPQVNHLDGNKENNAVTNLEWASNSDNEKHAHRTGLKSGRGSANSNAKLTATDVLDIRGSGKDPKVLAEEYGVSPSTIINVLKRHTWTHV